MLFFTNNHIVALGDHIKYNGDVITVTEIQGFVSNTGGIV